MSAYAPSPQVPRQLFGGFPLEQSPEEIRLLQYNALAINGLEAVALAEKEMAAQAHLQTENALKDLRGAVRYILDGEKQHPNRVDMCLPGFQQPPGQPQPTPAPQSSTPFGGQTNTSQEVGYATFGQPQSVNWAANQSLQPSQFGQVNMPNGSLNNTFGAASQSFPQQGTMRVESAFGQPQSSGFASSPLQPIVPPFGQTQTPLQQQSAFGQPEVPAQSNFPTSSAAAPQMMQMGVSNAHGIQPPPGGAFGQLHTAAGNAIPQVSHFGLPAAPPTQPTPSQVSQAIGFAMPNPLSVSASLNGFSAPQQINGFPTPQQSGMDMNGSRQSGAHPISSGNELRDAYMYLKQHGTFRDGIMPESPPEAGWL